MSMKILLVSSPIAVCSRNLVVADYASVSRTLPGLAHRSLAGGHPDVVTMPLIRIGIVILVTAATAPSLGTQRKR